MLWLVYLLISTSVPNLKRVYCTVVELFDVINIETLKSGLGVTQDHWKCYRSKALAQFSICVPYQIWPHLISVWG